MGMLMINNINLLALLKSLPRNSKQLIMIFIDAIAIVLILFSSFSIRLGVWYWPSDNLYWVIFGAPIISIPIFISFNLYRSIIRYIGFNSLWSIFKAVSLYSLIWGVIGFMAATEGIPRSVILINWFLGVLVFSGLRIVAKWLLSNRELEKNKNVVIYGAGSAGQQLYIALMETNDYRPVAFLDDNFEIQKQTINGVEIFPPNYLSRLLNKKDVSEVLLAMPSITRFRRKEIIDFLEPYPLLVRSLPSISELAKGSVKIADLHEIDIEDLLGRKSINADINLLSLNINSKVVLVTGAGGSIGSELCRQILFFKPKALLLFDISEYSLYLIEKELIKKRKDEIPILPILGSVTNKNRLTHIMKKYKVQTIYHAAAYKHVPMVELNNSEGVNNNILGTLFCAQVAISQNVETFVLVSTDKAVRPTNTMGSTKRFAEMILQALSIQKNETQFTIVRFGNVLGSSGSVIPLFKEQIREGGPVTITDSRMTRYFMTIPEAVELVIQAGAIGDGGDVFVLNMGEPVSIVELAKKIIHLSGLSVKDDLNPNGEIEIKYTGLRPGEKLYEELLIGDNVSETQHPMIMRAREKMINWDILNTIVDKLVIASDECDNKKIRQLLIEVVPEFNPQSEITDSIN